MRDIGTLRESICFVAGLLRGFIFRFSAFHEIPQARFVIAIAEFLLLRWIQLGPARPQLLVEYRLRLAGEALMLRKIEVAPRSDAFEFLRTERKLEKDVHGRTRV